MCQGHKKLLRVLCRIQKNPFMDLRLSLAEVSKATEDLVLNVGKRMRLTEPEQFHAMVKMHLR